jgi:YggT family protein
LFGPSYAATTPLGQMVQLFGQVLTIAIIVRALLSWFNLDPRNPLIQMLSMVTDPIIEPIRRVMPRIAMIDFSPFVAIILMQIVFTALAQFIDGTLG